MFSGYLLVNYTILQLLNVFHLLVPHFCHAHPHSYTCVVQKTQYHLEQVERKLEKNWKDLAGHWRVPLPLVGESVAPSVEAFHSCIFSLYATFLPPCLVLDRKTKQKKKNKMKRKNKFRSCVSFVAPLFVYNQKRKEKTMEFFHMNELFPIQFCCCCCRLLLVLLLLLFVTGVVVDIMYST